MVVKNNIAGIYTPKLNSIAVTALLGALLLISGVEAATPVGHWKLDQTSGTSVPDVSGNGNTGTVNGTATWVSGILDNAFDADYTDGNDFVSIPNSSSLENVQEGNYTIAAWFKPNSVPPGSGSNFDASYGIVIKEGTHTGLIYSNDQSFQMDHWLSSGAWAGSNTSDTFPPGVFYHVVGVVDRTAGTNKIYVNGVLYNTATFTPGTAAREYGTMRWRIGTARDSTGVYSWPADGTIDDVRIYGEALSDQDVENLYERLEGHWKFDETSGTACLDSSGNDRDAVFDDGSPNRITGIRADALEFDGADDVNTNDGFDLPSVGTIAFWARFAAVPSATQYLLGTFNNFTVTTDASGQIQFMVGSSGSTFSSVANVATAGEWRHVAVTYNSGTNAYEIYVDGTLDSSGTATINDPDTQLLSFATRSGLKSQRFVGAFDDIRIYAQQLSANQVQALYEVAGHWKFDETSGTTAVDSSGNGFDGTYENGSILGDPAVRGSGVTFNSADVDDHVDLPYQVVNGRSSISVSWWMNLDEINRPTIISGANAADDNEFRIYFRNDSAFRIYYSGSFHEVAIDAIPTGKWIHFVVQFNRSTGEIHIHRDGRLVHQSTVSAPGGSFEIDPGGLIVGQEQDSVGGGFESHQIVSGTIDDLWIFGRELNNAEIAELYGLVGHWKFDETSGTTAVDSSLSSFDGSLDNGTQIYQTGVYDRSYGFDGTNDRVTVNEGESLNLRESLTITGWIKSDTSTWNGSGFVMSKLNQFYFESSSGGTSVAATVAFDGGGNLTASYDMTNIEGGTIQQWHHYAAVYDYDAGTLRLYIDGVLRSSNLTTPGRQLVGDTSQIGIGWDTLSSNASSHLDGNADDVRLYNRALSEAEIKELYGLLLHWKLDETSGTTAADASLSGREGTVSGTTSWIDSPRDGGIDLASGAKIEHAGLPEAPENFSIACWARLDSVDTSGAEVVSVGDYLSLRLNGANGSPWGRFYNGSGHSIVSTNSADALRTGWHHYVVSFDHTSRQFKMYIDGKFINSSTQNQTIGWSGLGSAIILGQHGNGNTNYDFDGGIDDVRIFDRAITEEEIASIYGMTGHWTFDEGAGATIADSSLFGNDASFNTGTPTWVDGAFGYALEFDGTNDARTDQFFNPPATGAVSLWIRTDGPTSVRHRPWGVGSDFEMWQDPDGLISMDVGTDGFQGGFITTERFDDDNRWYHIVAQYDSDTDEYKIYMNGQLHKAGTSSWGISKQAANFLTFGTRTGSTQRFVGAIDDFRIFNRKLHTQEIASLYGILGHWKFDETSGTVAVDSSGAGNDGEYVNSPVLGTKSNLNTDLGTAVQLDGTSHIRIPGLLDKPANVTMMGWVHLDAIDSSGAEFLSLGDTFAIRLDSTTDGVHSFGYNGSTWDSSQVPNTIVTGTGWKHIAAVYDDHRNQQVFYINGEEVANNSELDSLVYGSLGSDLLIGKHGDGINNLFLTGRIDDVRVYGRALTPEEIRDNYGQSKLQGIRIIKWVEVR